MITDTGVTLKITFSRKVFTNTVNFHENSLNVHAKIHYFQGKTRNIQICLYSLLLNVQNVRVS